MSAARLRTAIVTALFLAGCQRPNPRYQVQDLQAQADLLASSPSPDLLATSDMLPCPSYPTGGGGGRDRPEVLVKGGNGVVDGVKTVVADFYLDVFDVTIGAYRDCYAAGGCASAPTNGAACNWTPAAGDKENHPVNCVSFSQAKDFCTWANRRLPREEEWAWAAGEGTSKYPWGADEPRQGAMAQLCWGRHDVVIGDMAPVDLGTCPVGLYRKTLRGELDCGGVAGPVPFVAAHGTLLT